MAPGDEAVRLFPELVALVQVGESGALALQHEVLRLGHSHCRRSHGSCRGNCLHHPRGHLVGRWDVAGGPVVVVVVVVPWGVGGQLAAAVPAAL